MFKKKKFVLSHFEKISPGDEQRLKIDSFQATNTTSGVGVGEHGEKINDKKTYETKHTLLIQRTDGKPTFIVSTTRQCGCICFHKKKKKSNQIKIKHCQKKKSDEAMYQYGSTEIF